MPEHYIRSREGWLDPAGPPWDHTVNGNGDYYVCPSFLGWSKIDTIVIHYPGADWADMDFNNDGQENIDDTVHVIRQMHNAYLMGSRGYSLGYCFVIGTSGDIWEVRGWEYANAANKGDSAHGTYPPAWNNTTISIQIVVDEQTPANDKQVSAVNWLIDEIIRQRQSPMNLTYHGAGQYTACPGSGIMDQIADGVIGIGKSQPEQPTNPIDPPEDDGMVITLFRPFDCKAQFIGPATLDGVAVYLSWVDKERADAHIAAGATINDGLSFGGFRNCVLIGPLPTGDELHSWDGSEFFRVVS